MQAVRTPDATRRTLVTEASDAVTFALTGHLSFNLLLAAVLTWPIAAGLLRLYTRAVRRSMRRSTPAAPSAGATAPIEASGADVASGQPAVSATLHDLPEGPASAGAAMLLARLLARPRRAALVYAIGGVAYGLVLSAASLLADGVEILPVRFLFLAWVFAWPVVLTAGMVAAPTRSSS